MWQGDPFINAYMRDYVDARAPLKQYGITLNIGGGQGDSLVSELMTEKEAGTQRRVDIDLVWINGETFYQLRQIDALQGPFTDHLPNNALVAWNDPTIRSTTSRRTRGRDGVPLGQRATGASSTIPPAWSAIRRVRWRRWKPG